MNTSASVLNLPNSQQSVSKPRILVIDVLRGFALLGILVAHITLWFDGGPLPQKFYQSFQNDILSGILVTLDEIFVRGKFFTIFSFLFGISFALQIIGKAEKEQNFLARYAWRLVLLGMIGVLHNIHWRGDILSIYAILGFFLLLFRNLPDRFLLLLAVLLIINLPIHIQSAYNSFINPKPMENGFGFDDKSAQAYYDIMMTGTYPQKLWANFKEFRAKIDFQFSSGRIYITLGFFLLGLYAGRHQFLQNLSENRSFFRKVFKYSGLLILGLLAIVLTLFALYANQKPMPPRWAIFVFQLVFDIFNAALAIFYIATISLLFLRTSWQKILHPLAPIGKMGLSNYLMQSAFGIFIFWGYGFGLVGKISPAMSILLAIPIFAFQIMFSIWWLRQFRYGPVEWLWRSATYFKWQKMQVKEN